MSQAYWSPERKLRGVQGPKTHIFTFGCIMWELYVSQKPRLRPGSKRHPHLGKFPASTPFSYVALATACMSPMACDRPSTVGILESMTDMQSELASKFYTDLSGSTQVRLMHCCFASQCKHVCIGCFMSCFTLVWLLYALFVGLPVFFVFPRQNSQILLD